MIIGLLALTYFAKDPGIFHHHKKREGDANKLKVLGALLKIPGKKCAIIPASSKLLLMLFAQV
jgi:hypothetical protein